MSPAERPNNLAKEQLVQSTRESINRARHLLYVVSVLSGIGFSQLFLWHFSWERARLNARQFIVQSLENRVENIDRKEPDSSLVDSVSRKDTMRMSGDLRRVAIYLAKAEDLPDTLLYALASDSVREQARLLEERVNERSINIPILAINMQVQDLPPVLALFSVVVLSWLLFAQKQVNDCLLKVKERQGYIIPGQLLQFHFILVRQDRGRIQKLAPRALILSIPIVLALLAGSDFWDYHHKIKPHVLGKFAIDYGDLRTDFYLREGLLIVGTLVSLGLARKCLGQFIKTESRVLEAEYDDIKIEGVSRVDQEPRAPDTSAHINQSGGHAS